MADVVGDVQRLLELPQHQHWLCPRNGRDAAGYYYDEDVYDDLATESQAAKTIRRSKLAEVEARKKALLNALRIFAFDGADAVKLQHLLLQHLGAQLSDCEVCVRAYHRARSDLKHSLEQQFDEEDIVSFMTTYDELNIKRITEGLHHARVLLERLPAPQRNIKSIDPRATYALFEALSCKPFICNEQLLAEHFDRPFQMVQMNRRLLLQCYLPATTHFLFSPNQERNKWAVVTWNRLKRPPTLAEFDWAIKEPLLAAMGRVQLHCLEAGFSPKFWSGLHLIVSKLNKDLITHAIRGLDYDVYKLVLDHLQLDPVAFLDVVRTLSVLINLSPSDLWDSMGSISPSTIVEQIFSSPVMEYVFMHARDDNAEGADGLSEVLAWIRPFVSSIQPSNRLPACRALIHQLMSKYQDEKYPEVAKSLCLKTALEVLNITLQALNEGKSESTFIGNASVYDALSLVSQYLDTILQTTKQIENSDIAEADIPVALQVVRKTVALDCLALTVYHRRIETKKLSQDKDTDSAALWQKVTNGIGSKAQALATHVLLGAIDLTGLEQFRALKDSTLSKSRMEWNSAFKTRCEYVTNILDRISNTFEGYSIAGMFKTRYLARAVVAPLLSSDDDTRQAAAAVYKTLSLEDGRREAIRYILEQPYEKFLCALADVVKILIAKRAYAPMPPLIRLSFDIHESLCNSQDGLLRSKDLTDPESDATKLYWETTWRALQMIFVSAEVWSFQGVDKADIMDFCKDAMQFVDAFFESYDIFVNAVAITDRSTGKDNSSEVANQLLSIPKETMKPIATWLRFRDEYLADKIVNLVCKLLVKLREIKQECDEQTLEYLRQVVTKKVKTKLSPQQCAQLQRAWEIHARRTMPRPEAKAAVLSAKQGSLNNWISADKTKQRQLEMKDVIAESTKAAQLYKERQMLKAAASKSREPQRPLLDAEAIRKRKEEAEARKRANANMARVLRGETATKLPEAKEPKKVEGVMVSSDEESGDERDARLDELMGFARDGQAEKSTGSIFANIPAPAPRPVKVNRIVRSAKDMRARLAPDLGPLHKEILSWDFFHEGAFPPGSDQEQYKAVPKKFRTVVEYKDIFRPLLILEAWQGMVKAREEMSFKPYEATVVTRATVNAAIEISTIVKHSDNPDQQPSDGDIVLFSTASTPHHSEKQPHCLARVIEVKRTKPHLEVLYRAIPSKTSPPFNAKSVVYAVKIQSLTPLEREYGALAGLEYYDLAEFILSARPSHLLTYADKQLDPIARNYQLNKAQATAVRSALDNDAFTLVQGPPGSGKTKTIVAIVGALLSQGSSFQDQGTAVRNPMETPAPSRMPKKLLVCAPSNAAVDELVMRFKQGVMTMNGKSEDVNVVRLGRSDAINAQVLDVTLDELVNKRLNLNADSKADPRVEIQKINKEHQAISEKLRLAREKENSGTVNTADEMTALTDEIKALAARKRELGNLGDAARDRANRANRAAELARKQARQAILDSAHVICATLSGSGHEMFQNLNLEFETVILDEAAQCVEMSALIPLKYGCAKCILVGDPKQLPPTVFSREAARFQYEQSLFQRMQTNDPKAVHMLDTQYRMHPEISLFPSTTFYDKRLLDGPGMSKLRLRPWHANNLLGPYCFFNVAGKHESASTGHSLINRAEIDIADALYTRLTKDYPAYDFNGKIGIITPYKSQLRELKFFFTRKYGRGITEAVEFNTTDAFQGRESEVIIFSCVRAQDKGSVGFLADIRRMNVGLTRAKSSLWVLGNASTLVRGEFWRKMIEDAQARDRFLTADQYLGPLMDPQDSMPLKLRPAEPKDVEMTDVVSSPVAVPSPVESNHAPTAQMMPATNNDISSKNGTLAHSGPGTPRSVESEPATAEIVKYQTSSNRRSSVDSSRSDATGKSTPSRPRLLGPDRPPIKRRITPMDNNPLLIRKKQKKN